MDTESKKIAGLINSLTNNEDLRQDMWVAYLSGTPLVNLRQKILEKLITYHTQSKVYNAYELSKIDIPLDLLMFFTANERHVMFLLYLGYNIGEISVTLGESRVTIISSILSIKQNTAWNKIKWHLNNHSLKKKD
jgi:hypothetical protein